MTPMGMPSCTNCSRWFVRLVAAWLCVPMAGLAAQQPTLATTVPLILPGGLAYDSGGNLYFAETANHVVRRVTTAGILTTFAGTGTQGFAGDGGAATLALLDSPTGIAFDAAGDLFIADAHNHRIRRVDAVSGLISTIVGTAVAGASADGTLAASALIDLPSALAFDTAQNLYFADARRHVVRRIDHVTGAVTTVAGNGTQGFSGDLGSATSASIDSPSGMAIDGAGNVYLADTHNQRVRRVDAVSGMITSVVGTGQPGFSGDGQSSPGAALNLPRGLALDAAGNLFVVDARNQRIRRVDLATGQIATIAGDGTQAFAGDASPAVVASLDTPRAITISPGNLPTLADSGNERVRQVDAAAVIRTIAGLGATAGTTLNLSGPTVTTYGTGSVAATLAASAATGAVTFFDTVSNATQTLATMPLSANVATLATSSLVAGMHSLSATYAGDALHAAAQSTAHSMNVVPSQVVATPNGVSVLYGQAIPVLTGSLSGVLARDTGLVTLAWSSPATPSSVPGAYAITAAIGGNAAGNYALSQNVANVTISQAPSSITLTNALAVHVASTTTGVPTGTVNLYDAGTLVAKSGLSASGDAVFSTAGLSAGTHTLGASYPGDVDFLASTSESTVATIGTGTTADFALAANGATSVTVPSGTAAAFSFAVSPVNGTLSSPILLSASGLPVGATASFNPAYLPPSNASAAFILTIQTAKKASLEGRRVWLYALLVPLLLVRKRRLSRSAMLIALLGMVGMASGCGDRVNYSSQTTATGTSYSIVVTGTATSASGLTLLHSASVSLTLQ